VEYLEARDQYKASKENQRAKHQRVQELETKNKPAHDFREYVPPLQHSSELAQLIQISEMDKSYKQYERLRTQKQRGVQDKMRALATTWTTQEKLVRGSRPISGPCRSIDPSLGQRS
jgi:hypothetical protein